MVQASVLTHWPRSVCRGCVEQGRQFAKAAVFDGLCAECKLRELGYHVDLRPMPDLGAL